MNERDLIEEFESNYDFNLIKLLEPLGLCHQARSRWIIEEGIFKKESIEKQEETVLEFIQKFGFQYEKSNKREDPS